MAGDNSLKKILVVDDEKEILTHLANILRRAEYEVISALKGREAVELAKNQRPDLIILDIALPDINGHEVALFLSKNPSTADIPIVFLTGTLTEEGGSVLQDSSRHSVMVKPVTGEELLEIIRKHLPS